MAADKTANGAAKKSHEAKVDKIVSGIAAAAKKQNQRDAKLARIVIEAEFETDSSDISLVMDDVRAAIEQLECNGCVIITKAKLSLPATEMDFT